MWVNQCTKYGISEPSVSNNGIRLASPDQEAWSHDNNILPLGLRKQLVLAVLTPLTRFWGAQVQLTHSFAMDRLEITDSCHLRPYKQLLPCLPPPPATAATDGDDKDT